MTITPITTVDSGKYNCCGSTRDGKDSVCTHAKVDVGFAYDYERDGFLAITTSGHFITLIDTFVSENGSIGSRRARVNNNIEENVILPTFEVKIVKNPR